MKKSLLWTLVLFFSPIVGAQTTSASKLKPLLFQADKNNIQVLPQRFEYTLLDDDRFKIGDILLDTTQVHFQIEPAKDNPENYNIRFQWPASLIKQGQLSLKDSSGKAIFSTDLNRENIQLRAGEATDSDQPLRSEIATFTAENLPAALIEEMKYLPIMKFCIFRETEETRLYLCSQELYLSSQDNKMIVKTRQPSQESASIEINGKNVGRQGLIYLNDRKENIAFKAQTRTGAFLEIETRMKEVDFKDAILSPDNENIILTASGALPVDDSIVKKINETDWQIQLPLARPLLYLKGDGDIPMRQEFFIRGELPKEKNRAYISSTSQSRTYSSDLTFSGLTSNENTVKSPAQSGTSLVQALKKNTFRWSISDIPKGTKSSHFLIVSNNGKDFTARYDVFRGTPFLLSLEGLYKNPSQTSVGSVELQWWLENFFTLKNSWSSFHWGLGLERLQQLSETKETPLRHHTTIELLWRAHDGFPMRDGTWGLSLPLQMVESGSQSESHAGFGAFISYQPQGWWNKMMDWYDVKIHILSSGLRLKESSYWSLSSHLYIRYGIELDQYKAITPGASEEMQIGVHGGILWKF